MLTKAYFEDVLYGRRKSALVGAVLVVLSLIYSVLVLLRSLGYRFHLLKSRVLSCPVVSIGNLTLGGTGKTPTVIAVADLFARNGKNPLVVSRGYGRTKESDIMVVADKSTVLASAAAGGDEPVLIATRLAHVPVVVGSDRYRAARLGMARFSSDVVVLDDGFQHLRLRRTLDVVLVDGRDPFGSGKLFPAGILREPLSSLSRAQAVLLTRVDPSVDVETLKARIRRYTEARIFTSGHRPLDVVDCTTGEVKSLSALRGTRAFVFSGIARPATFTALLASLGVDIVAQQAYPDHFRYQKSDLAAIYEQAADARASMILTTEKDRVRLREHNPDGIWALRIELAVNEQREWEEFLLTRI